MKLRIDYCWIREEGAITGQKQYHWLIDSQAPEIKTLDELEAYLLDYAKSWSGEGMLKIIGVSDSFKNPTIEKLSQQIKGKVFVFSDEGTKQ